MVRYITLLVFTLTFFIGTAARSQPRQAAQACQANRVIVSVAISPDGKHLSASWDRGYARLWDFNTGAVLYTWLGYDNVNVDSVTFSPDGKYVLTSAENGFAVLWDTHTGTKVRTFGSLEDNEGLQAAFLPDGKAILGNYLKGTVLWDTESGKVLHIVPNENEFLDNKISPDGKHILTQHSPVAVWDVEKGKQIHSFGDNSPQEAFYSPSGNYIFTAIGEELQIWNAQTFALVRILPEGYGLSFSPDDRYIILSGGQDTDILWNVQTGKLAHTFTYNTDLLREAFFNSKPFLLILENSDPQTVVHIWDLEKQTEATRFSLPYTLGTGFPSIDTFLILKDDTSMITASTDGTLVLWNLQTGKKMRQFC